MSDSLYEKRLEICKKCPLYKEDLVYGPVCNSSKYLSPDGTKTSYFSRPGYIRGCGCKLKYKAANERSKCIAGK